MSSAGVIAHCLAAQDESLRPRLMTNRYHYTGAPDALAIGANATGFPGDTTLIRMTPDGRYCAVSEREDTNVDRFLFYKFSFETNTWSQLANPVDYPAYGPSSMCWSDNGLFLAIAGVDSAANYPWVYRRDGDVLTRLPLPASPLGAGNGRHAMKWDRSGSRLATGQANSGAGLVLYDFDGNDLLNMRAASTAGTGGTAFHCDWHPSDDRYIMAGTSAGMYLARDDGGSCAVATFSTTDADTGCWWTADGDHFIVVDNVTVSAWSFTPNSPGTEAIALVYTSLDVLSNPGFDADIDASRRYLAISTPSGGMQPEVYTWATATPEPAHLAALASTGGSVTSVCWNKRA